MSRTVSLEVGRAYGLDRVCRVLESPRSTHYRRLSPRSPDDRPASKKRGPKPIVSDEELLALLQGIGKFYGKPGKNVASGLALRMDHGRQYTSDYFPDQVGHLGMRASFAYLHEPETNGVAERFFKTFKEQIVHGRIYRNIADLRTAAVAFVNRYNHQWLVEKNGFLTPEEKRSAWLDAQWQAAA